MVVASGDRFGITVGIGALINLAVATDRPRLAMRLVGVLDEFADVNQVVPPRPLRELTDQFLAPVRAAAGATFGTLHAEGRRLALEDAVTEALTDRPEEPWRVGHGPALTPRETRGRAAGGRRAEQPRHRRATVPVRADRGRPCRPRPDQARLPQPRPTHRMGARTGARTAKYVAAT